MCVLIETVKIASSACDYGSFFYEIVGEVMVNYVSYKFFVSKVSVNNQEEILLDGYGFKTC